MGGYVKYALLAVSVALLVPLQAPAQSDPPIRLKLARQTLTPTQGEKVRVRAAADGYLVVLRTDTEGSIRIVFPVNPSDEGSIKAGRDVEIRGRGDRDAFAAFEKPGSGTVLAAWADHPFTFAEFETHGHWTRAGLVADSAAADPEAAMLAIVDQMSASPYQYDLAEYTVQDRGSRVARAGWYDPWYDSWYGPWYSPWYGSAFAPWATYPYFYGRGPRIGIVVRPRFGGRRFR
jgi:Domain of unknown function (DUF4384)